MGSRKVALVTGSGKRRIGNEVARALGERGYAIAVHYRGSEDEARQTAEQLNAQGIEAAPFHADFADDQAAIQLIERVLTRFGRIDVLAHCAAAYHSKTLEDITIEDVRREWEVNTLATFVLSQRTGMAMVRQAEGGSIVLFGDWATVRPYRDYAAYFVSKGAIATMTRCLAVELGTRNPRVRVNCIQPGPVLFPPDLPAAERQRSLRSTLARREGSPDCVARAVLHFVENDYLTGVCLPVDGGRTIYASDCD